MPENLPKPHDPEHRTLVERDRYVSGALSLVAFAEAGDPAGELARLQVGIGLPALDVRSVELNRTAAMELALTLLAFANGNWMGITETELEVRHGQLRLELERAHG